MIRPATPQRTARVPRVEPTPTIAPVMVWVVETGIPQWASARIVTPPPVSAQKPPMGASFVRLCPIVFTIRQPPNIVPMPIAPPHASATQNGTVRGALGSAESLSDQTEP